MPLPSWTSPPVGTCGCELPKPVRSPRRFGAARPPWFRHGSTGSCPGARECRCRVRTAPTTAPHCESGGSQQPEGMPGVPPGSPARAWTAKNRRQQKGQMLAHEEWYAEGATPASASPVQAAFAKEGNRGVGDRVWAGKLGANDERSRTRPSATVARRRGARSGKLALRGGRRQRGSALGFPCGSGRRACYPGRRPPASA